MSTQIAFVFALVLALAPIRSVAAQEAPTAETVSGTVVNQTTGEPAPAGLEVMLHGWGGDGQMIEMLHGELEPGGRFVLDDVQLLPEAAYAAMVVYQDVTYFSSPAEPMEDGKLAPIGISIYESTNSDDRVLVDQHHIFLDFRQGGLAVSEVYAITNEGDRAILNALSIGDDQTATLQFPLPEGAANVYFPMAPADRYISQTGSFADTRPLTPGERTGQVVVSYVLSYGGDLTLEQIVPYDTNSTSVLMPHGSGLSFENDEAEYLGVETFADGNTYEAYAFGAMAAGEPIELVISGLPETQVSGMGAAQKGTRSAEGIAAGLGALGLALIGAGIWWWRRERGTDELLEEEWEAGEAGAN